MTLARTLATRAALATALGVLAPVAAQQAPPTGRVIVVPPMRPSYEATSRQQQVSDQLRKGQLEEQLRQGAAEALRRPHAADREQTELLDRADRAQRERYRARQEDLLQRYRDAVQPPYPPAPAPARSG